MYRALNLAFHVGDDPSAVRRNREAILGALGFGLDDLVCGEQVHGNLVRVVDGAARGCGARTPATALPGTDGLVTGSPGVVLGAFFADCVPVFLADIAGRCVGLVHAGWRGTAAGIVRAGVKVMEEVFGVAPASLAAVIGPAIGACCYEVGEDVVAQIEAAGVAGVAWRTAQGRWRLDLAQANRAQLVGAGVDPGLIRIMPYCTFCSRDLFYSHRGSGGLTGRMGGFIALKRVGEDGQDSRG